jgi:hypothetical protein
MKPLPLPVRIAAGLVATAVEQARDLPRMVVEFPVTAVSQALQASMRVQQKVTELAIKGDRALGTLRPVEDKPSWATFDDDQPPHRNGASSVTELRPASRAEPAVEPPAETAAETAAATTRAAAEHAAPTEAEPSGDDADGPNVLPGYRDMTLPQLRGRLRHLSVEDLRALLAWEQAHEARPPFVTMLANRITTVAEG